MGNIFSFSFSLSLDRCVYGCWDRMTARANYVCKLEENCRALEIAKTNLMSQKNDMKSKVSSAVGGGLEPLEQVTSWISRVEAAEAEINDVIEGGSQETEKLCLGGCCSKSFKSSYKFGKRLAEKLEYVASLKREGDFFKEVAGKKPLAPVQPRPSDQDPVGIESTFDQVWSCLGQEDVGIIGLYGLGGVGKTTLLTKINNHFSSDSGFVIIWVVVSKDLNLQTIQDDIWKRLRYPDDSWKQKRQDERAAEIFRVLNEKKFVLLLDDMWEQIDLKEVGVPPPNKTNKSKIVFTTRSKDVCGLMDANKTIEVGCLSPKKAWELFQQKVGADTLSSHPDIPRLAETVVGECKGLPLALITVGRAMANKNTLQQWKHAIDTLRDSASKFSGMEAKVLARLKFSFDLLPEAGEYKSCFLYCALFPEDYMIDKSNLIDYWTGEGFLGKYDKLDSGRNEGHDIIGTLVNACLLEAKNDGGIKMHDLIRDMALWIVSKNGEKKENYFLVQAGAGLTETPQIEKWEGAKMISLMRNKIKQVRISPSCTNLTTLLLNHNIIENISDDVFDHMPNLRVLDLSYNISLRQLPLGISKLVSLQYLNLFATNISKLPIELTSLENLKYLNLGKMYYLNFIPKNLLSSFLKLQVCRMVGSKDDLCYTNEGLMEELESLNYLQDLGIGITNATSLQKCFLSEKLQRCTRLLSLLNINDLGSIKVSFLEKFWSLNGLTIAHLKSLKELEIDWNAIRSTITSLSFFQNLHHVRIFDCPKLRDMTWLLFAPNIRSVELMRCDEMKKVLDIEKLGESGEEATNLNPFSRLETLSLVGLPQLESIYPNAITFSCLTEIKVFHCQQLKRLPLNSDSARGREITIEGEQKWWVNLYWEDEAARNTFTPCFKEKI